MIFDVKLGDNLHISLGEPGPAPSSDGERESFPSSALQKGLVLSWEGGAEAAASRATSAQAQGEPGTGAAGDVAAPPPRGLAPAGAAAGAGFLQTGRPPRIECLCQEGVGFGVPVLKKGLEAVFPGEMRIVSADQGRGRVSVEYRMNLVDRLTRTGSGRALGRLFNLLLMIAAAIHRRLPFARRMLTALSNLVRTAMGFRNAFLPSGSAGTIRVDVSIGRPERGARVGSSAMKSDRPLPVRIRVCMDASGLESDGLSEIIIMNEQGADHFSRYADSDDVVREGPDIGTWNRVSASEASFIDRRHGICFDLRNVPGAELYRGRERQEGRLAWAGFGYVLPTRTRRFLYDIDICAAPLSSGSPHSSEASAPPPAAPPHLSS